MNLRVFQKLQTYWKFLAAGLFIYLVKAVFYIRFSWELLYGNALEQHIPAEITMGHLFAPPDTYPYFLSHGLLTTLPQIEAALMGYFSIDYHPLFIVFTLCTLLMALMGTFIIGESITKSKWGGLYCCVVLEWGWIHRSTFGYTIDFDSGMYPGVLGFSLGLLTLGLWMKENWILSLASLGLLFGIHITNSVAVGIAILMHVILLTTSGKMSGFKLRRVLFGAVIGGALAFPEARLIFSNGFPALPDELKGLWWTWIRLRKTFHVFPWAESYQRVQLLLLLFMVLAGLFFANKKQLICFKINEKIRILVGTVIGLIIINWGGVELFSSAEMAAMILTRSSLYLVPIAAAFVFMIGSRLLECQRTEHLVLATLVLSSNFMFSGSPRNWAIFIGPIVTALVLFRFESSFLYKLRGSLKILVFLSILALAYFLFSYKIDPLEFVWAIAILLAPFALGRALNTNQFVRFIPYYLAFLIIFYVFIDQRKIQVDLQGMATSDWHSLDELKVWADGHTDRKDIFLAPPSISCGIYCIGRTPLAQSVNLGMSIYLRQALPFELRVLSSVFQIDINKVEAKTLRLDISRYFDETYDRFNKEDILRISKEFNAVRYFVTFQRGPNAAKIDLPIRFQNKKYIVYEVPLVVVENKV